MPLKHEAQKSPFSKAGCINEDHHMDTVIDDGKIKDLFKQAIIETIEEKKDIVHDLLMEVMDDLAMIRAIEEGENTGSIDREEIFNILDGKEGSA